MKMLLSGIRISMNRRTELSARTSCFSLLFDAEALAELDQDRCRRNNRAQMFACAR